MIAKYIEERKNIERYNLKPTLNVQKSTLGDWYLYLYSFIKPIRLKSLWSKYFKDKFSVGFDIRHSFSYKK